MDSRRAWVDSRRAWADRSSWLSGGLVQRQIRHQAAPSSGQPRPTRHSHLGRDGPQAISGHSGRAFRQIRMRWPGRCAGQWAAARRTPAPRAARAAAAASCRRHVLRRRGSPCTDARCCLAARSWNKVLPDGTAPKLGRATAAAVAAGVSASAGVPPVTLRAHRRPSGRRHVSVLCLQPRRCGCRRGGSGRPTAQRWHSVASGCTQSSTRQP